MTHNNDNDAELLARCRQFAEVAGGDARYAILQDLVDSSTLGTAAGTQCQRALFYTEVMLSSPWGGKNQKKKKKKKKKQANELRHIVPLLTDERRLLAQEIEDAQAEGNKRDAAAHLLLSEVDPTLHVISLEDFRAEGRAAQQTITPPVLQKWMQLRQEWKPDQQTETTSDLAFEHVLQQLSQYIVDNVNVNRPLRLTARAKVDSWLPPEDPVLSMPGRNIQAAWQDYLAIRQKMPQRAAEQMGKGMARLLSAIINRRQLGTADVPDPSLRQLTNKYFVDAAGEWAAVKRAYAVPWTILVTGTQQMAPFDLGTRDAAAFSVKRARLESNLVHTVMSGLVKTLYASDPCRQQPHSTREGAAAVAQDRLRASLLCSCVLVELCLP